MRPCYVAIGQIFYKIVSKSQLFIVKSRFLEEKAHFFGNKTVNQGSGANKKKLIFAKIFCKFLAFLGFLQQKR